MVEIVLEHYLTMIRNKHDIEWLYRAVTIIYQFKPITQLKSRNSIKVYILSELAQAV